MRRTATGAAGCAASPARRNKSPKRLIRQSLDRYTRGLDFSYPLPRSVMKVLSSLKSAKARHRDCKVVRRRGKVFVICKSNPRFKARQR